MARHTHWRDCQAWLSEGLPLSTTSNEAAKMYDASLTQIVSLFPDESNGGLEASLGRMLEADPDFLLGHALCNSLTASGTGKRLDRDADYRASVDSMNELREKKDVTPREELHALASEALTRGEMMEAITYWESILLNHPTDMLAARMVHNTHVITGFYPQLRDSVARIMPAWKPSTPLYEYLFGMYAFGLEETNFYEKAEKMAKKGLSINERDPWAVHAVAHVMEMTGRYQEGIDFMTSTEHNWSKSGFLKGHNYWHYGLFNIEKGDFETAIGLYDNHVVPGTRGGEMFPFTDAAATLYRLEMQGVNVGDRWADLYELARPHLDDHLWIFDDVHLTLACLKSHEKDVAVKKLMDSIETFVRDGSGFCHDVLRDVGQPICQSFVAYEEGDYAKAVDLLNPVRYQHYRIGGSGAQRDLIDQFFIHAAIQSSNKDHNKLARHLVAERRANKGESPLNDRLMAKILAEHGDS